MDCLFCKIVNREIPANIIYEDETTLAFDDINPIAPIHKLIIPKQHIATLNDLTEADAAIIGQVMLTAKKLAAKLAIADAGFRTVFNCNEQAGQTVFHIHCHLISGRPLSWPPG